MQNITLLSFIAHIAINIFFDIKKRLGFKTAATPLPFFRSTYRNAVLSAAMVSMVIAINIFQFGNVIEKNIDPNSTYNQLASLFINQSVWAQENTIPFGSISRVDKPTPDNTGCRSRIELAMANSNTGIEIKTQTKKNTELPTMPQEPNIRSVVIQKNGSLWEATRQLIAAYIGQNPCVGLKTAGQEECEALLDQLINAQTSKYLIQNNLMPPGNRGVVLVPVGTTVTLDINGKMTVTY